MKSICQKLKIYQKCIVCLQAKELFLTTAWKVAKNTSEPSPISKSNQLWWSKWQWPFELKRNKVGTPRDHSRPKRLMRHYLQIHLPSNYQKMKSKKIKTTSRHWRNWYHKQAERKKRRRHKQEGLKPLQVVRSAMKSGSTTKRTLYQNRWSCQGLAHTHKDISKISTIIAAISCQSKNKFSHSLQTVK